MSSIFDRRTITHFLRATCTVQCHHVSWRLDCDGGPATPIIARYFQHCWACDDESDHGDNIGLEFQAWSSRLALSWPSPPEMTKFIRLIVDRNRWMISFLYPSSCELRAIHLRPSPTMSLDFDSKPFNLGVFYVREDLQMRWYFTLKTDLNVRIQDLAKQIDDRAGVNGENLLNDEREERDFTGIHLREPLPHFWKLGECGVQDGHALLAVESRSSRCICKDNEHLEAPVTISAGGGSGCAILSLSSLPRRVQLQAVGP